MKLTPSNVAAAAVIGAVLGWVVQPAFDEIPVPKPVLNCEQAQCVPAAARDNPQLLVPVIEQLDSFDI
jgi:hypothetical protein